LIKHKRSLKKELFLLKGLSFQRSRKKMDKPETLRQKTKKTPVFDPNVLSKASRNKYLAYFQLDVQS
jgi:hypothetical protein